MGDNEDAQTSNLCESLVLKLYEKPYARNPHVSFREGR